MKNKITVILFIIVTIIVIVGIIMTNNLMKRVNEYQNESRNENIVIDEIEETTKVENKDIVEEYVTIIEYAYDIKDKELRWENTDNVIIGTVEELLGATNYNEEIEEYTEIMTQGKIKVENQLKGNIEESEIDFLRIGGTITVEQYLKSLTEEQKEKEGNLSKLSEEEQKEKYVSLEIEDDIKIEENKTYLMFLGKAYNNTEYIIELERYGLYEVDGASLEKLHNIETIEDFRNSKEEIIVKNNDTGEYESILNFI